MKYALNLDAEGRILSATYPKYAPRDAVTVDELPDGNLNDYRYVDGDFVYDPLPEPEPEQPAEPTPNESVWDELDAAYQAGYNEGYKEGVNSAYGNE